MEPYESIQIEVIYFETEDIIVTSGGEDGIPLDDVDV